MASLDAGSTHPARLTVERKRGLLARVSAVALLALLGTASAQQPAPVVPKPPDDTSLTKVYGLLDRLCAKCHQTGKLTSLRPARGFGNVLDLAAIAADPARVRSGNPDASRLYTLMQSRLAPHDFSNDDLSGDDLDAVRDWIKSAPTAAVVCRDRQSIERDGVVAAVAKTLTDAGTEQAKTLRFLSLTTAYNACTDDTDLKVYGEALGHTINGLSWGLDPYVVEAIDAARTVFKIDLAKIGWTSEKWERLTAVYPYAARAPSNAELEALTGTKLPVLRGDWFVAAAGRAPLYYELLGLPERSSALLTSLKVDTNIAIAQGRVRRIGIKTSNVARGNRLLQRVPFANGSIWTTYEYAPTPGRPDLFDAPGGPGSRGAPKPDASLMMFSLPSGFNAFFMTNGDGVRLNDLPLSVMRDDGHASGRITAGAGCLACHSAGMQPATDEIRQRVQGDTTVPRDIRERTLALHATSDDNQRLFDEDNTRIVKALSGAGLTPALTQNGQDPVSALVLAYDRPLTLQAVAAELDMAPARLSELAMSLPGASGDLLQRLVHGPVTRRDFDARFAGIVRDLAAQAGGGVASATGVDAQPSPAYRDRPDPLDLILKTNKVAFATGELLTINARATEPCYLTLINIDRNGRGTVVFPNDFEANNLLDAGMDIRVPAEGAPYQFRMRDKGRETIVGICLAGQKTPAGIKHDFERQRFTELGDYRAFLKRTATLELDERNPPKAATTSRLTTPRGRRNRVEQPEPSRTGDPQARTAIQITVD